MQRKNTWKRNPLSLNGHLTNEIAMLIDFICDFETRSRLNLKHVGSWKYSKHPSTEMTLLTYCFGRTDRVRVWCKGQPVPAEILHVMRNPHLYRFIAWNVAFDYAIWVNVLSRMVPDLKPFPVDNIEDGMALSCHFRTGASLESCSAMLNLNMSKDKIGRQLMLKTCKPMANGNFYEMNASEWTDFIRYGVGDTEILRQAYYRLPRLPDSERFAWAWTFKRNLQGVAIDMDLVHALNDIIEANKPKLMAEFAWLTGYKCTMNSPIKCKEFFKQYYPWIQDMAADTVRDMLAEDPNKVPYNVRRALEIKDLAGSTSISKLGAMINHEFEGRIYGLFAYHEAQSKRWAGRGVQVQNNPRVDDTLQDKIDFDLNITDLAGYVRSIQHSLLDPVGFVKNMLRRVWLPNKGQTFYSGDWAKVEPSVLYWFCDLGPIPKKWYEIMAADIYGKSPDEITKDSLERQIGKQANLSCQYGTGWESFQKVTYKETAIRLTDEMAKQVVQAYRRKHPEITKFWRDLETAFRLAVYGQTTALSRGRIHIMPLQSVYPGFRGVAIRLPSGSYLFYHGAKEIEEEYEEEVVELRYGAEIKYKVKKRRMVLCYLSDAGAGRIFTKKVYSGLFCENVVSATSRDLLVPAIWRFEQYNFDVLGLVHDEGWASGQAGLEDLFEHLMCINPSWCDMQIGAEVKSGVRYLK